MEKFNPTFLVKEKPIETWWYLLKIWCWIVSARYRANFKSNLRVFIFEEKSARKIFIAIERSKGPPDSVNHGYKRFNGSCRFSSRPLSSTLFFFFFFLRGARKRERKETRDKRLEEQNYIFPLCLSNIWTSDQFLIFQSNQLSNRSWLNPDRLNNRSKQYRKSIVFKSLEQCCFE